jgi:hypothetical protein
MKRGLTPARRPRPAVAPVRDFNQYGRFAADLPQVQPSATIDAIHDCRLGVHQRTPRPRYFALDRRFAGVAASFQVGHSDKVGEASFGLAESVDAEP